MSSGDAGSSDLNLLANRIAALEQIEAQLEAAISYGTKVRLALAGLLILFVLGFSFVLMTTGQRIMNRKDAYIAEVTKQSDPTMDLIMREIQTLTKNTAQPVTEIFQAQVDKDLEKFLDAAGAERDVFVDSLQAKLDKKIAEHYGNVLKKHEEILRREFPSIKNEEDYGKMIGNFQIAVDKLVKKYYGEEFGRQMDRMYLSWETFPAAEMPPGGKTELHEQLKGLLVELFAAVFTATRYDVPDDDLDAGN